MNERDDLTEMLRPLVHSRQTGRANSTCRLVEQIAIVVQCQDGLVGDMRSAADAIRDCLKKALNSE